MARKKYPKLGNRFKKLRKEHDTVAKDYTQDMLSKEIHIQKPQISELENGKRLPSINELQAYSKFFNTPMEYLLGTKNSRYYENMLSSEDLGLSDEVINALKFWLKESPKCNIVYILNHIFKIGYGYPLLNALSHYFYCAGIEFQLFQREDSIKQEDENDIRHWCARRNNKVSVLTSKEGRIAEIRIEDIEYIFQEKLYKLLSKIREELKKEKMQCETCFYDGFDEEIYMNLEAIPFDFDANKITNDTEFMEYLKNLRGKNGIL